jgi:hypothetical protein
MRHARLALVLALAAAGCASRPFMHETVDAAGGIWIYTMPPGPVDFAPTGEPVPLRVTLVIDPSVREARWTSPWRDARIVVPLDELLPESVECAARSAFAEVDTTGQAADVDALLYVRFVGAAKTLTGLRRGPSLLAIALEWRIEGPAGRLVWADTIVGRSPRQAGKERVHPTDQIERAFLDLLARSHEALVNAPEIRALGSSVPASPAHARQ